MPVKSNKALKELLVAENTSVDHAKEVGNKIRDEILSGLKTWDPTLEDYNPLVEIAKLGLGDHEDNNMKLRAHTELAHYMYPQIGRVEIHNQEDKKIDITIQISDFAKSTAIEVEPEDIETEGDIDPDVPQDMMDEIKRANAEELKHTKPDYNAFVLKSLPKNES